MSHRAVPVLILLDSEPYMHGCVEAMENSGIQVSEYAILSRLQRVREEVVPNQRQILFVGPVSNRDREVMDFLREMTGKNPELVIGNFGFLSPRIVDDEGIFTVFAGIGVGKDFAKRLLQEVNYFLAGYAPFQATGDAVD